MGHHEWHQALLWGGVVGIVTTPIFRVGVLFFGSVLTAYLVAGPDHTDTDLMSATPNKRLITRRANQGWMVAVSGALLALAVGNLTRPGLLFHGRVWLSMTVESVGFTLMALGAIIVGAASWGALFNAYLLPDRTWFRRLRSTGVLAAATLPVLGLGAVIGAIVLTAWARRAPDGIAGRSPVDSFTPSLLSPTR